MAITLVNQTPAVGQSGVTIPITIPAPTAGNSLFLISGTIGGFTITGVIGGGVTWAQQIQESTVGGVEIWAGPNSSGSGTTVTVTPSNQFNRFDFIVAEFSGMPSTLVLDGSAPSNGNTGGGNNVTTATITPTAGKVAVILAGAATQFAIGGSPTGGFTAFTTTATNTRGAYQIVASTSGSYSSIIGTESTFSNYGTVIAGFDGSSTAVSKLFRQANLSNGAGGPFFSDPLGKVIDKGRKLVSMYRPLRPA